MLVIVCVIWLEESIRVSCRGRQSSTAEEAVQLSLQIPADQGAASANTHQCHQHRDDAH